MYDARDVERATRGQVRSGLLRQWVHRGLTPTPKRSRPGGTAKGFSEAEVLFFAWMGALRGRGLGVGSSR